MRFPFLAFEEYPPETRILLLMHILGAVDDENSKRLAELSDILGINGAALRRLLQKLLESGYIMSFRDNFRRLRFYLTKLGILRVLSAFS